MMYRERASQHGALKRKLASRPLPARSDYTKAPVIHRILSQARGRSKKAQEKGTPTRSISAINRIVSRNAAAIRP